MKEKSGREICCHILFIHAISGCDTTSGLYGSSKGLPLKKFVSDTHFREHVKVFDSLPGSKEEIVKVVNNSLFVFTKGGLEKGLMDYDFVAIMKRCPLVLPRFTLEA